MTKKEEMYNFLKCVFAKKLMTKFLTNIFDYYGLEDYNYISRVDIKNNDVILDVFDNITENRFNRYCFNFDENCNYKVSREYDNVFITRISVLSLDDSSDKLIKFAYLFKLSMDDRIKYSLDFLDKEFIDILKKENFS